MWLRSQARSWKHIYSQLFFSFWEHLNPKKSANLTNANVKVSSFTEKLNTDIK